MGLAPPPSRFTGCFLGGALGDALGYPVEFLQSLAAVESAIGPASGPRLAIGEGGLALVSDDTQMTLFTAEGLIRARLPGRAPSVGSLVESLRSAYLRWLFTQTGEGGDAFRGDALAGGWLLGIPALHEQRAPGRTCLSALSGLASGAVVDVARGTPPNDSKGCGAVMRSAPIGLAMSTSRDAFDVARDAALLTHGHPGGYLSAAYFAVVVHVVSWAGTLLEGMVVADGLLESERDGRLVRRAVDRARTAASAGPPAPAAIEALGGGWVGEEALSIALLCALTAGEPSTEATRAALWRSVAHAGDSDSTGSLTGNLIGAMHGVEAMPQDWLEELEMRDVIERIAVDLHAAYLLDSPDKTRYPGI
jgi:ADP-ribosylglycohydrolase